MRADTPASGAALSFPQIANGGGYQTTLVFMNTSSSSESGLIHFYSNSGSDLAVRLDSGGTNSVFPYSISPGGFLRVVTDGSPADVNTGWAQVIPNAGTTAPAGAAMFSLRQGGNLVTEAGVPNAVPTTHARVYVDKSGGHDTGIALANPGTSSQRVVIDGYQADGTALAGSSTATIDLSPSGHAAKFVGEMLPVVSSGFTGVLDISSSSPFVAVTLRSLTNALGSFLLTALPVADATQSPPAPLVFPQVADGGGYQTQIILLNTSSTASSATVRYFGNDGSPLAIGQSVASSAQSPSQLPPISCAAESSLRSIEGVTATSIEFLNHRANAVRVHWQDYSGQRVFYFVVLAGQSITQPTFVTHPWLVTDLSNQCIGIYLPKSTAAQGVLEP